MIDKIILARLDITRRTKIDAIRLARVLNHIVGARQADKVRVELCEVLFQHRRSVARGVARYHEGEQHFAVLRDHFVVHEGHFVEFVWADVGAVCEAEVNLVQGLKLDVLAKEGSV